MKPERWRQITETFHAALARERDVRGAFLAEACDGDLDLRAEVDALLAAHHAAGEFGERPAFAATDVTAVAQGLGRALAQAPPEPHVGAASTRRRHPFVWVVCASGAFVLAFFGYAVFLLARGGQLHSVNNLTNLLDCFVWCLVGLFIGLARPDQPAARLACLSALATVNVYLDADIVRSGLDPAPLHAVLGYHFFCRFPDGGFPRGMWRIALVLLYVMGAAAIAGELWFAVPRGGGLTLIAFAGALVGMFAVIPYKYRRLAGEDQRRRVRWVVYGSVFGLAPNLWYLAEASAGGSVGPGPKLLVDISSMAIPLSMAYAVVKHRVLDIRVVVRRGLQYLLARRALQAAVALPIAVLAYTAVVNRHRTVAEIVAEKGAYLLWVGAAGLGLRFRRPIQAWLDRRFFREQLDREQVLLGLLDDAGRLESMSELSRLITSKLDSALHPKTMYLWYRDPAELSAASAADPLLAPADLPPEGRWLAWLEALGTTATLPAPAEAGLPPEEALWFAEREVSLIVPITDSGDRVVGALLLGEKKSEQPYGPSDRQLVQALAQETAVVRENLRLRARVSEEQRIRHDVLAQLDDRLPDLLKECPACGACFDGPVDRCARDGEPLVLSLPVSRTLDGRYHLEQLIGKGGMGAVYEARDLRLGRPVAVKVMLGRAFGQPAALRRFKREAHAAARLSHPSIVGVYDFGSLEGQGAYIVMERVSGVTLRAELVRAGVLAPATAADWFEPLLDGLAAAHAQGIVHRDLKPENVIGRREGPRLLVKIVDFGLARFPAAERPASGTLTAEGVVVGTRGYMSPEQLLGRELDHRTDIFAVGVMLVEALTGRRPFEGDPHANLSSTLPDARPYLPGASSSARSLDALLQKCLARDPRERYASAAALRDDLIPALRALPL